MDKLIKVGERAKDFSLLDQNDEKVSLKAFKGKQVLLSWHPLAWTSVCMDQMRSIEREYEKFTERNTVPIGLSVDPAPSKSAWAKFLCLDNLKIVSDFNPLGEVSKFYGVFSKEDNISMRANVLIDKNGIVKWVKVYELAELPDVEEIIANL